MAAPTNAANVKKVLVNSEPSTHGPKRRSLNVRFSAASGGEADMIDLRRPRDDHDLDARYCATPRAPSHCRRRFNAMSIIGLNPARNAVASAKSYVGPALTYIRCTSIRSDSPLRIAAASEQGDRRDLFTATDAGSTAPITPAASSSPRPASQAPPQGQEPRDTRHRCRSPPAAPSSPPHRLHEGTAGTAPDQPAPTPATPTMPAQIGSCRISIWAISIIASIQSPNNSIPDFLKARGHAVPA